MDEDGPLVASGKAKSAIRTVEYTYLLELDGNNKIIGGEWLSKSNDEHPDFLWFPVAKPSANTVTKVGLSYKNVQDLLTASVSGSC